jgi:hydrogenase maturation protein HypF
LLLAPEAPIVLLDRNAGRTQIAAAVAPGNPALGVLLPYTPLHHLLLGELGFPVVATSGNLCDEPICIDERDALARLHGIADTFLVHNRPIVRHADDSVVRVMLGRELVLRRARGYAPLPVRLTREVPTILATGAHLKNTVALSAGRDVFVSQHIGDLETQPAFAAFRSVVSDFQRLYEPQLDAVACDLHPDYLSTKFAREISASPTSVQHHYAHVLSCMAENELDAPALGVAWDGTGCGTDGTIWGGEFLRIDETSFERAAHFRTFSLPGGEAAMRQPRRAALGLLHAIFGDAVFERLDLAPVRAFTPVERSVLRQSLAKNLNAPRTSSAGRLFDAAAALLGVRQCATFEGQAAMELEWAVQRGVERSYPIEAGGAVDWEPAIRAMLADDAPLGVKAAAFHNTLAEAIVRVALEVGERNVVLSGGCFQNRYLTERAVARLRQEGFRPYWHQRVPTNDGGIALGQVVGAARALRGAVPARANTFEEARV